MNVGALARRVGCVVAIVVLTGCAVGKHPLEASNATGEKMLAAQQAELGDAGQAPAADSQQPANPTAVSQSPSAYRLAAGDEVSIVSQRRAELSMTARIDPYGYFSYPYLGQVRAAGLTAQELANRLTTQLQAGDYYTRPVITVGLVSSREQYVYVLGEVHRPGPIPVYGGVPLLVALGKAGGQTYDAEMHTVLWIRGSTDPAGVVKINLGGFGDPRSADPRIPKLNLIPGDILFVPDSLIASVERAFGRFGNLINPIVELERGLVLYPDVEDFLQGDTGSRGNQVIIAPVR